MHQGLGQLLGSSTALEAVRAQVRRIAQLDATVLIEGETGTGKEVAARSVHYLGGRRDRPFVPVNCGALADALVESELFGHERGAFTDAKASSFGLVSEARDGTLFLDEVDALSLKAQAALLRFLQDGSYRRVGGTGQRRSEARVIVASNANLQALAEARLFRQDLLYRINVLTVRLPPLRERGDDALELAQHFLRRLSAHHRRPAARFSPGALQHIRTNAWPGNVRELENFVQRAFLLSDQDDIELPGHGPAFVPPSDEPTSLKAAKQRAMAELEGDFVRRLLAQSQGNISQAARLAGQDRSAFRRLVKRCGVAPALGCEPKPTDAP